ncbi:MAG TPA: LysM peptidoglycan-binding domain-containing protein [Candidatus Saccharibacteria bacterium]|nr:LysM peptidoglycan-binding domain-containing protein [Candidatus Saccharibacteria bacterium]
MKQQVFAKHRKTKKTRFPLGRTVAYSGAFIALVAVVAVGYESPQEVSGQPVSVTEGAVNSTLTSNNTPSVDDVIASNVAADLAERANLPIASNAANLSVSLAAENELAQTDTTAITKPQIIKPTSTNRSLTKYVVKRGDTVPSVAKKFGISSDTIRWANNLSDTDALEPGRKLTILPVSGIMHTVESGESAADIARKYRTSEDRIIAFNDLELSGPTAGRRIVVPGGIKPAAVAPVVNNFAGVPGDVSGGVIDAGLAGASAGNRYAPGNCTWYAYERRAQLGRPVGSFWGNGASWAANARAAGYLVNNRPAAGAVLVDMAGYFGHVGVVERVKSNGDIVITEMNNYAYGGFNIVNERTISAGQAGAYTYIH